MNNNFVLSYSEGLNTLYRAIYLSNDLGYEVNAVNISTACFDLKNSHQKDHHDKD